MYILCVGASLHQTHRSRMRSFNFQCIIFKIFSCFTFFLWCRQSSRSWSEWDVRVTGSRALSQKCIIIFSVCRLLFTQRVPGMLHVLQSVSMRLSRAMNRRWYNLVNHLRAKFLQHEMQLKSDCSLGDEICDQSNGQACCLILPIMRALYALRLWVNGRIVYGALQWLYVTANTLSNKLHSELHLSPTCNYIIALPTGRHDLCRNLVITQGKCKYGTSLLWRENSGWIISFLFRKWCTMCAETYLEHHTR
jgi:hypothetical protein